ncbi:MAG: class I SAM-dependent methyltransferase [Bryobacteraceae bacterium]|nr:class I SAM-dependent methyltransferase [Bryobacteraceae bacterium]MCX7603405.1 class I SAM-dependent methyltransferase [Bryobacteraceae bacterium]
MASRHPPRVYRSLAEHYDKIFSPLRHPLDLARKRLLEPLLGNVKSACDLGCGTAATALELARRGIRTFAVDLSPAMCRVAREKVRHAALPVQVLCADMRSFRLPEPVDLVLCECDALNHLPARADLARVARAVAQALAPGGWFYFDVNNARGFERYWTGEFWIEREGLAVAMHNGYDPVRRRAWSNVDLFVREGRLWRRLQERVEEVCWTGAEIREALKAAGFTAIRCHDAAPFFRGYPDFDRGCRSIYLARKQLRNSPAPSSASRSTKK